MNINRLLDKIMFYTIAIIFIWFMFYIRVHPEYILYEIPQELEDNFDYKVNQTLLIHNKDLPPKIDCNVDYLHSAAPNDKIIVLDGVTCKITNFAISPNDVYLKKANPFLFFVWRYQIWLTFGVILFALRDYFTKGGIAKLKKDIRTIYNKFKYIKLTDK